MSTAIAANDMVRFREDFWLKTKTIPSTIPVAITSFSMITRGSPLESSILPLSVSKTDFSPPSFCLRPP